MTLKETLRDIATASLALKMTHFERAREEEKRPFEAAEQEETNITSYGKPVTYGDTRPPTEYEIVFALAKHFGVEGTVALQWLKSIEWGRVRL
jgi:hypothetical protein